jgi:hypothetical protein
MNKKAMPVTVVDRAVALKDGARSSLVNNRVGIVRIGRAQWVDTVEFNRFFSLWV